jgi:hypothetical protein
MRQIGGGLLGDERTEHLAAHDVLARRKWGQVQLGHELGLVAIGGEGAPLNGSMVNRDGTHLIQ